MNPHNIKSESGTFEEYINARGIQGMVIRPESGSLQPLREKIPYNTLGSIFFYKNSRFFFKILQKVNLQKWLSITP